MKTITVILIILICLCICSKTETFGGFSFVNDMRAAINKLFNRTPEEVSVNPRGVQEVKVGNVVVGQRRWYADDDGRTYQFDYHVAPGASLWANETLYSTENTLGGIAPGYARPVDHTTMTPSNIKPSPHMAPHVEEPQQYTPPNIRDIYQDDIVRQHRLMYPPPPKSNYFSSTIGNLQQQLQDAFDAYKNKNKKEKE